MTVAGQPRIHTGVPCDLTAERSRGRSHLSCPPMAFTVLVLAGTTEASALARLLDHARLRRDLVAGGQVTSAPLPRPGRVRTGGFGGTDGLAAYLRAEGIAAVVDATHPFAAVMPFHVADACAATGVPHCRLIRPPWTPIDGDRWTRRPRPCPMPPHRTGRRLGARRVFLAIGRQGLAAFAVGQAPCGSSPARSSRSRSCSPTSSRSSAASPVHGRSPELALLRDHRIDTVVITKNAGGGATAAKLIRRPRARPARGHGRAAALRRRPERSPGGPPPEAALAVARPARTGPRWRFARLQPGIVPETVIYTYARMELYLGTQLDDYTPNHMLGTGPGRFFLVNGSPAGPRSTASEHRADAHRPPAPAML